MTDLATISQWWRQHAGERKLSLRLMMVGFPATISDALDGADRRDPVLVRWAREGLASGRVLRSAQSERLAEGRSLDEVAAITGVPVFDTREVRPGDPTSCVLAALAWPGPPEEEEDA